MSAARNSALMLSEMTNRESAPTLNPGSDQHEQGAFDMTIPPDTRVYPAVQSLSALLLCVLIALAMIQRDPADRDAMLAVLRADGWLV